METKHVVIFAAVGIALVIVAVGVGLYFALKTEVPSCPSGTSSNGPNGSTNGRSLAIGGGVVHGAGEGPKFLEYQEAALKLHNKLRKRHDAEPLKLSEELHEIAEKCAKHYAKIHAIDHSCPNKVLGDGTKVGENLYFGFHSDPKDKSVGNDVEVAKLGTQWWYDEIRFYDFSSPVPKNFMEVGHFTQLVWRATKELGVGIARSPSKDKVFLVAIYNPTGNYNNLYQENVHPVENPA